MSYSIIFLSSVAGTLNLSYASSSSTITKLDPIRASTSESPLERHRRHPLWPAIGSCATIGLEVYSTSTLGLPDRVDAEPFTAQVLTK